MAGTFDFCPNSKVVVEIPPDEPGVATMNGWEFRPRPKVPYRPTFKITLHGMRWYLNSAGTALDVTTNPTLNAGRLLNFYKSNRTWDVFTFNHEYLGSLVVRFNKPVSIPPAEGESKGLIKAFEVELIQNNPAW